MKKTQKTIAKSLLAKIEWLEYHAWEVIFLTMLAGPFLAMPVEAMIRGYNFNPCQGSVFTMRDTPSAMIVTLLGVLLFITSLILQKVMRKKLINVYSSLSSEEQSEVQWIDGWQYRNHKK